jgi:Transcription factor WhiB
MSRPRRRKITTAPLIELAAEILHGVPSLPNAACRGKQDLFDATTDTDRTAAMAHCAHCDDLAACQAWMRAIPRHRRPQGVVAGVYRGPVP